MAVDRNRISLGSATLDVIDKGTELCLLIENTGGMTRIARPYHVSCTMFRSFARGKEMKNFIAINFVYLRRPSLILLT